MVRVEGHKKLIASFLPAIAFTVPLAIYKGTSDYVLLKISLTQLFLLLTLIIWFHGAIIRRRDLTLRRIPLDRPLFFFFLFALISLFGSRYRWAGGPEIYRLVTYLLLYIVSVNILGDRRHLNRLVFFWLLSTGLASLYGLEQHFFKGMTPPRSTFGNANFFAAYLVLPFPLVLAIFINSIFSGGRKNWGRILSLAVLLPVMTLSLFLASSRGAWLGLGVSLISLSWLACLRVGRRRFATRVIPAFLALILILSAFLAPRLLKKESVKEGLEKGTLGIRVLIWEGTFRMIAAHPFLGSGPGSFQVAYPPYRLPEYFGNPHAVDSTAHAHNEFLEIAAETGILGLAAFLWVLIIFFIKGIDIVREEAARSQRVLTMGLISGVAGLLATNLVGVNLRFPSSAIFFWLALGLVMSQSPVTGYTLLPLHPCRHRRARAGTGGLRVTNFSLPLRRVIFGFALLLMVGAGWQAVAKPFLADMYFQRGINYRKAGDWEKAISGYRKAVELDPYFVKVYYRLGFAYASIGDMDRAISAYGRVKELAPYYARVDRNLGFIFFKKRDWEKAAVSLEEALRLNPEDAGGHNFLGVAYAKTGRSREAEQQFIMAININSGDAALYNNLGNVYAERGEIGRAVSNYRKALELRPDDKEFRANLEKASRNEEGEAGK